MKKLSFFAAIAIFATLLLAGCVTHKKKGAKDDVSAFKKGYHSLTSHYNYWFNANELLTLTQQNLSKEHKDNYNQLLPLYPYTVADPVAIRPDMDKVVKKSSTAVALHRVGEWTDDCYLLIGQAQYMKQDFETAEATFVFFKEELNPNRPSKKDKKLSSKKKSDTKKKKAKKKKPKKKKKKKSSKKKSSKSSKDKKAEGETSKAAADDKKAVKEEADKNKSKLGNPYSDGIADRTSAYPEAMVWYARTLTKREKYEEAEYLIRDLQADRFFPESLKGELALAETFNYLEQKRYAAAITPLKTAVENTSKKDGKARLAYILAQLYAMSGDQAASYQALATVLDSRPDFTMEFNAKLLQIRSGWESGNVAGAEADRGLQRMLKEDKYKDFYDQVYFTQAIIALKEKRTADAITAFKQSLLANTSNQAQKAESYIALADLYFELEDFVNAKNYYDSTMTAMAATDERLKQATLYAKNLTDIARLITLVADNDSIVRVFNMSDSERKDLAKQIKKQQEEVEKTAAIKDAAAAAEEKKGAGAPSPGFAAAGVAASSFYFYNDAFLKKGKRDFDKTFGNRQLTDNWRRKNKLGSVDFNAGVGKTDSLAGDEVADIDIADIFKGIPKSQDELAVIHQSTYQSLFKLGVLFREKIENNRKAMLTHEDELKRFPDSLSLLKDTWYYLYLSHRDLGNKAEAQRYMDSLLLQYPNDAYTRAISDANFVNATKEKERKLNQYYKETFEAYSNGNYADAFKRCQSAGGMFGGTNPLMPKFSLLSAMCTGNIEGQGAYCSALKTVIGSYPDSPEAVRAREIARLLECEGFAGGAKDPSAEGGLPEGAEEFTQEADKIHYFVIVLHGADVPVNAVKTAISDYNRKYHSTEGLRLSNIFLGTDTNTPIMVIRKFDNQTIAMKYYKEILNKAEVLGGDPTKWSAEYYPITQDNYRRILKNRSLDGYIDFFNDYYLSE